MNSPNMTKVIDRKKYNTDTATLIASDVYWDGRNMERGGRNTFLYRTRKGRYFEVTLTMWQGERDTLTPLSMDDAIDLYENLLPTHEVDYEEAFPEVSIEEA